MSKKDPLGLYGHLKSQKHSVKCLELIGKCAHLSKCIYEPLNHKSMASPKEGGWMCKSITKLYKICVLYYKSSETI